MLNRTKNSEIVDAGQLGPLPARVMRPKRGRRYPYILLETIDKDGNVSEERTGHDDGYWQESLADRDRIIVAVLNGPSIDGVRSLMDVEKGERERLLAEARARHGYRFVSDGFGGQKVDRFDPNAEIYKRFQKAQMKVAQAKSLKPSTKLSMGDVTGALMQMMAGGAAAQASPAAVAAQAANQSRLEARIAQLEAMLAAIPGAPTPAQVAGAPVSPASAAQAAPPAQAPSIPVADEDDDEPAPPENRGRGKRG